MILQRLAEHYDRLTASGNEENSLAPAGFSQQKISFCVVLEPDGRLNQFQSLQEKKGKANVATPMIVPGQSKPTGQGINPCFLWDNACYMLGWSEDAKLLCEATPSEAQEEWVVNDTEWYAAYEKLPKKLYRSLATFKEFRKKHCDLESQIDHPAFHAVCAFLRAWSPQEGLHYEEQLATIASNFGVFRIVGERRYVHESIEIPQQMEDAEATQTDESVGEDTAICLITGLTGRIARLHEPKIKGVPGAQSSGALLVSFNAPAFESYGRSQSYNAPVSEATTTKYATALNHLLDRRDRRIQLGDSTVVFWADHDSALLEDALGDAFAEPYSEGETAVEESKERLRQARILLTQLRDGTQDTEILADKEPTKFFLLSLSPNASRLSVRLWVEADASELQRRLGQHLRDIDLGYKRDDRLLTLRRIADATGRAVVEKGKPLKFDTKATSPQLAGDLARSVLTGSAYPQSLLATMLHRVRSDGEVAYARVAAIKACLIRNSRLRGNPLEVSIMLDKNNTDSAYCCGRIFALLEMIQQNSVEGDLNRTIKDSYFSSASATPALIFPRLCRLSQHHLAKLPVGLRINREKELGEVLGKLNAFPRHLSTEDQGKFVLGYFHQRQDLYTSKKDKAEGANQ